MDVNKAQVVLATSMVKDAFDLLNQAEEIFGFNGIQMCAIDPNFGFKREDRVHMYSGIDRLAEVYGKDLTVDESTKTKDKGFKLGEMLFFEIVQPDGTYR